MPMAECRASARLFFALWPDATVGRTLLHNRQRLKAIRGRWVKPEKIHVTLLFLGQVPRGRIADLAAAAASVRCPGFVLRFDTLQFWRRSGILCLTPSAASPALSALVAQLQRAATEGGFAADTRPYRAHLTLARKVGVRGPLPRDLETEPVIWRADSFCLVESAATGTGTSYHVVETWPLQDEVKS